jgi:hypothetical protein
MRHPFGITLPRGLFSYLFFGTITTIGVTAIIFRLLTGGT